MIEPKYQDADCFKDVFAKVMEEGKWGVIDKTGHEIVPTEYDDIVPFLEGQAIVEKNERYGEIQMNIGFTLLA